MYAHADYWRETACVAMLEAMACGLPVVVTNAGGMREYLLHGRSGFACDSNEELIGFTRLLLERPDLRRQMGAEARRFVECHHSIANLNQRLHQLLSL